MAFPLYIFGKSLLHLLCASNRVSIIENYLCVLRCYLGQAQPTLSYHCQAPIVKPLLEHGGMVRVLPVNKAINQLFSPGYSTEGSTRAALTLDCCLYNLHRLRRRDHLQMPLFVRGFYPLLRAFGAGDTCGVIPSH